ncbi:transpeptidase family protein [Candidatus Sumerlaeota bacterium]|nr:transpeptidase family protein [Candidatus Sumerlaeota bacterium]
MSRPLERTHHRRLTIVVALLLLCFLGLMLRLVYLTVALHPHYRDRADLQHRNATEVMPRRGEIFDREGRAMAVSVLCESLYVNCSAAPRDVREEVARACEEIFGQPAEGYLRRLQGDQRIPLVRRMEANQANRLRAVIQGLDLGSIDIVYLAPETRRLYPMETVGASVIGFTRPDHTGDNEGVAGIEFLLNDLLRGRAASGEALQNAALQPMEPLGLEILTVTAGHQVHLTIDSVIQRVAEDALAETVEHFEADWGTAVVIDIPTGDVLAMASCPTFDLNQRASEPEESKRNCAIMNAIEPGSIMKVFTFAAAMEEGLIDEEEIIDCMGGIWYHPARSRPIRDDRSHRFHLLPLHEAFAFSSNIATVQVADRLTTEQLCETYRAFGLGQRTDIGLPGERTGTLRRPSEWWGTDRISIPIGQAISVTALQTAAAMAAIGNGGVWQQPNLIQRVEDAAGNEVALDLPRERRSVVSSLTARRMAALLEEAVEIGTGTEAQIEGYRVGGKTGTATRYDEDLGQYMENSYVATFTGLAPINDPRIACAVFVSNPNRRIGHYGGEVAAPVFREIMEASLHILGISADPLTVAGEAPPEVVIEAAARLEAPTSSDTPQINLPPAESDHLMPNLMGLTMREVTQRLTTRDLLLRFQGSGRVVSQTPVAGTSLRGVSRVMLVFEESEGG